MPPRPLKRSVTFLLLATLATTFLATPADARRGKSPERYFRGEIILSQKRFPRSFKSDKAMIKHMKKVNTHEFHANESGKWSFEYMVFARKPVGTLRASVTYYDITTPGTQKLVNTFKFYAAEKSDRILNGHASLSEDREFQANRKYLMVFSRGYGTKPLATTKFILRDAR